MRTNVLLSLLFAFVTATAGTAGAQDASRDAEAHAMSQAGATAYADGRYADALVDFRRSYELSRRPELLYNIGQCEDRLRHDEQAVAAFEQFIAADPESEHRSGVEARLAALRAAIAERATPTVATPTADRGDDVGPWVLGIGAAVLAVGGGISIGLGAADAATVNGSPDGAPWSAYRDAADRSPLLEGIGIAALGVAAVGAVIAVVWALGGGSSHQSARRSPWTVSF